jgi:hypothetical protein
MAENFTSDDFKKLNKLYGALFKSSSKIVENFYKLGNGNLSNLKIYIVHDIFENYVYFYVDEIPGRYNFHCIKLSFEELLLDNYEEKINEKFNERKEKENDRIFDLEELRKLKNIEIDLKERDRLNSIYGSNNS